MNSKHMNEWRDLNPFIKKLSDDDRHKLYEELKRSGSIENPLKYTETHLEGGIENVMENENDDTIPSSK